METNKKYRLRDVLKMLNYVKENPTEYRVVVELKRNHETISNKIAYYDYDYYMFDLSDGCGKEVFDKFLVSACMFKSGYGCFASRMNACAFIMELVRHNKVRKIYIDCY